MRGEVGHVSEITTFSNYNFDRDSDEEKRQKIEVALNGKVHASACKEKLL